LYRESRRLAPEGFVTRLEKILSQAATDLAAAEVEFALVGGLAVSVRTEPRFTRDADLVVAIKDDQEAESLVYFLQSRGYSVQATVEQEAAGRLATVRLAPPEAESAGMVVDLLFVSSGIESEVARAAGLLELLPGLTLPVAQVGHLIALKVLSREDRKRPQDIVDLRALLQIASAEERERAKDSLKLIESRGFNRGRDLLSDFRTLLEESVS
jgi:predicted nucleotidyltransferase